MEKKATVMRNHSKLESHYLQSNVSKLENEFIFEFSLFTRENVSKLEDKFISEFSCKLEDEFIFEISWRG